MRRAFMLMLMRCITPSRMPMHRMAAARVLPARTILARAPLSGEPGERRQVRRRISSERKAICRLEPLLDEPTPLTWDTRASPNGQSREPSAEFLLPAREGPWTPRDRAMASGFFFAEHAHIRGY